MAVRKVLKIDIAKQQLKTALRLNAEGQDPFSVVTLAGAAEEILGKLLVETGCPPALQVRQQLVARIFPGKTTDKRIADVANRARNDLKHHAVGADPSIDIDPEQAAEDMLDRAIENYYVLTNDLTAAMVEWQRRRYA